MRNVFSKIPVRFAIVILSVLLAFSGIGTVKTHAAGTSEDAEPYKSFNYSLIVTDYSTTIKGSKSTIPVKTYYMRLELSGKDAASKKINKALKKIAKSYDPANIISIANAMSEEYEAPKDTVYADRTLYDYTDSQIVYNDGQYLSVTVSRYWMAGGVGNTYNNGYTFDLKTGKRASITKITGMSLDDIKTRLISNIAADGDGESYTADTINNMKASDFRFYLKDGNQCVVTFEPYEVSFGGWCREYIIEY